MHPVILFSIFYVIFQITSHFDPNNRQYGVDTSEKFKNSIFCALGIIVHHSEMENLYLQMVTTTGLLSLPQKKFKIPAANWN